MPIELDKRLTDSDSCLREGFNLAMHKIMLKVERYEEMSDMILKKEYQFLAMCSNLFKFVSYNGIQDLYTCAYRYLSGPQNVDSLPHKYL